MNETEEKYLTFRSLGAPLSSRICRNLEKIRLSSTLSVTYDHYGDKMVLERTMMLNGTEIVTNLFEHGLKTMSAPNTLYTCVAVEDYENGFHKVRGCTKTLFYNSFHLEKGTFLSSVIQPDYVFCVVKFNDSLKLDFDDVPDCLLKYFPTITKSNLRQKGVMFVDLDVEQV